MMEPLFPRSIAEEFARKGFQRGWDDALDAVRESVERLPAHGRVAYSLAVSKAKVIEAIDALRDESQSHRSQ